MLCYETMVMDHKQRQTAEGVLRLGCKNEQDGWRGARAGKSYTYCLSMSRSPMSFSSCM